MSNALQESINTVEPSENSRSGSRFRGKKRRRQQKKKPKLTKKSRHIFLKQQNMALVDEQSCICMKNELDLFDVPPTQASIDQGCIVDYQPIAALYDIGSIEFYIPDSMYLHLSVKIRGADCSVLADDAPVAPINLLMHSFFIHEEISLNDKLISSASGNYAYRAFLETLLNYEKPAKDSQLAAGLWYKDDAGVMVVRDNAIAGFVKRKHLFERSKTIDLVDRLHSDLFFQEKLLLNGIYLRLMLALNKDSFVCFPMLKIPSSKST